MLPVRLKIQAFASYANAVEIDFEKLKNLFLIHGETGSGKTAILDAMMFALYGVSSGNERSTYRCALPAAKDIPTEVEFTFRSGGELYKFVRTIKIDHKNKPETKANCFVYDDTQKLFRSLIENPTATNVSGEAVKITGLGADQFRQVIILPQGKFERLLTSSTKDKEKILSTLFDTEKYTAITKKISEKAAAMKDEILKEDNALAAILATENADSIDALKQMAEENSKKKTELVPLISEAEQKLNEIRKTLTEAEVISEKFRSFAETEKRISELNLKAEKIELIKQKLSANSKAMKIRPEYAETIAAAEALTNRRNQLASAKISAESALKNYTAVSEKGKVIEKGEKIYRNTLSEIAVLTGLETVYDKITVAESRRSKVSRELADAEKSCMLLTEAMKKLSAEYEKASAEQIEIQEKYALSLPGLMSRKKSLEEGAAAEKNLIRYTNALEKIKSEIEQMKKEAVVLEKQKSAAEKNYDILYHGFIANTAAELSSSLKEGMPCPVCGSTTHPCPAKASDNTVTSAMVKNAKEDFEKAYNKLAEKLNEIKIQENRIPDAEEHINNMLKIIRDCSYSADELKKVTEEAEFAQKKNELLPQLRQRISQLSTQQLDVKTNYDEVLQRKSLLQSEASAANTEAELLRNQLDKRYPDAVSYKTGIARMKAEAEKFENEKSAYESETKKAEKIRIETSSALAQAEEEILTAQKNCDNANKRFSASLSQAGFPTVEAYRNALLSENAATEYAAETERYDLERHSLNERAAQLKSELHGKEKPELDIIRQNADEAQKLFSEKAMKLSAVNQRYEQQQKIIADCLGRSEQTEQQRKKYKDLADFEAFMVGSKSISFTRYILGIILGLVVDEANSILSNVHGGRFRLCIKTELSANSNQGLDLEVETITADGNIKYGVKDLSGGEKFLISLALSLGLSAVVQKRSGGIKIDAMFIDEGFGSLDTSLLREAVGILCGLTSNRSTIGIISHVSELKSIIPCGISVEKDKEGCSTILSAL